ncbi:hypothetical protein [Burkholderia ubonensis]|uniref:hypothetical protein n=1 Tax=Burkholderia ubonensis TaxID=101571 RepID=UPI00075E321B|nr:hypothetical protein [Burkholderia ubonensis]KVV07354.1 hypothetical protein WK77_16325 [Burkholderia ubonensis]
MLTKAEAKQRAEQVEARLRTLGYPIKRNHAYQALAAAFSFPDWNRMNAAIAAVPQSERSTPDVDVKARELMRYAPISEAGSGNSSGSSLCLRAAFNAPDWRQMNDAIGNLCGDARADVKQFAAELTHYVLLSEAGTGKSSALCLRAYEEMVAGRVPLFISFGCDPSIDRAIAAQFKDSVAKVWLFCGGDERANCLEDVTVTLEAPSRPRAIFVTIDSTSHHPPRTSDRSVQESMLCVLPSALKLLGTRNLAVRSLLDRISLVLLDEFHRIWGSKRPASDDLPDAWSTLNAWADQGIRVIAATQMPPASIGRGPHAFKHKLVVLASAWWSAPARQNTGKLRSIALETAFDELPGGSEYFELGEPITLIGRDELFERAAAYTYAILGKGAALNGAGRYWHWNELLAPRQ